MKKEKQQKYLIKTSKNKRKTLPVELRVNIFKETNNLFSNGLLKCQTTYFKEIGMKKKIPTTKKQIRKYWYKCAKNLLTSSGIIYLFVREDFKKTMSKEFSTRIIKMSDQGPGDFQLVTTLKSSLAEARIVVLQSIEYKKKQDELNKEQAELNKKQAELNKAQDEFNKKQDGLNKGHADLHENNVTLISKLEESIKLASTFIAKRQQVLVWDMQDFCSTFQLPTKKKSFDPTLKDALAKLCEHGFMSENIGYTLVSILDAQTDEEALQNKSVCSSSAVLSSDKLQKCNEVRNIYDKSKSVLGLTELLFGCEINSVELQQRMDAIEKATESRLKLFKDCLNKVHNAPDCVNVVLSFNQSLFDVLGLLILSGLNSFVDVENVFCVNQDGDENIIIDKLSKRFDKDFIKIVTSSDKFKQIAVKNRLHYSYIDSVDDLESVRSFLLDASSIMVHKFPGVNFCTIPKCEEPIPVGNWSAHLGIHDMAKKSVSPIKKSQLAKKRKLK